MTVRRQSLHESLSADHNPTSIISDTAKRLCVPCGSPIPQTIRGDPVARHATFQNIEVGSLESSPPCMIKPATSLLDGCESHYSEPTPYSPERSLLSSFRASPSEPVEKQKKNCGGNGINNIEKSLPFPDSKS